MADTLVPVSVALVALSAALLAFLVVRRLFLSIGESRRVRLELQLQPLALDVIDGTLDTRALLLRRESRTLAIIVERYSRRLTGGRARDNVAVFFEQRGDIRREVGRLGARRAWRRASAAYLLGDMASPAAIPALLAALDDASRDVRAAAARSLGVLGSEQAVPRLVGCLAARTVPRGVAGSALMMIGSMARAPVRALLAHDDAEVRATAAGLLAFVGSPADAPQVVAMLDDPAAEVRAAAARALARIGSDAAAVALRSALRDRVPFVRSAAADSLAVLDAADAADALVELARADGHEPAQAAARALARVAPERAVAAARVPGAGPYLLQAAGMAQMAP
jgi:hypothetical protein